MKKLILNLAFALAIASSAFSKMRNVEFSELVSASSLIVVAKVDSVKMVDKVKVAFATVDQVLKGSSGKKISFSVQKTWTCDASHAVAGEVVLLCLSPCRNSSAPYEITYSGRGRIPLTKSASGWNARIWKHSPGPEPWSLNVNLLLPSKAKVVKLSTTKGTVGLADLVALIPKPRAA